MGVTENGAWVSQKSLDIPLSSTKLNYEGKVINLLS